MRVALDLFCGTGGATAAFRRKNLDWKVIGVDIDRRHNPDIRADVQHFAYSDLPRRHGDLDCQVDFIWASPPCNEFSTMPPGRDDRRPSLDLVFAALTVVRDLRPKFWIIENVRGALPFLGVPRQKIGPFCLWGYFPRIKAPLEVVDYRKMTPENRTAVERAAIPYALSLAVLEAVERSWERKTIADLRPYRRHRHVAKLNRSGPAWRPTSDGHAAVSPAARPRGQAAPADGHLAGGQVAVARPPATWPEDLG